MNDMDPKPFWSEVWMTFGVGKKGTLRKAAKKEREIKAGPLRKNHFF